MTDPLSLHPPQTLLSALCNTINHSIHPLSAAAMAHPRNQLFGAAILLKSDLSLVHANTNQASSSPLWHGETYTIAEFFKLPASQRPATKDCIFLTTHEPCSLCINAIAWSGFDNFIYLWPYEETASQFGVTGDLTVWAKCFYDDGKSVVEGGARQASLDGTVAQRRPQYRATNELFVARSFAELLAAVEDPEVKKEWVGKVEETKRSYGSLLGEYRKRMGLDG